jgi:hypothetical protein
MATSHINGRSDNESTTDLDALIIGVGFGVR